MLGINEYTNITEEATVFPISLLFMRIVQIHYQGTKRRMRFLWPADFSRLGNCKNREKIRSTRAFREIMFVFAARKEKNIMSYSEMAQLELMNALNSIDSEAELNEFKDLLARYFAEKAQKAIDALWDEGVINEETIEQWGAEHMRTPYRHAAHRS